MSTIPTDESSWKATDLNRLHRFLCFGTEQPVLVTSKNMMREDRLGVVQRLIDNGQGLKVVDDIKDFTQNFRSFNQEALLYALAVCAKCSHEDIRKAAYSCLQLVCPTPEQLFLFLEYAKKLSLNPTEGVGARGWGKMQRKAINTWYGSRSAMELAKMVTEYRHRHNWSHLDVLRLTHVKVDNQEQSLAISYVVNAKKALEQTTDSLSDEGKQILKYLTAVESVRRSEDATQVATLIEEHQLPWQLVPTKLRNDKTVWKSLLRTDVSMTTLLQHLPLIASLDLLSNDSEVTSLVIQRLTDSQALESARTHPLDVLKVFQCYKKGQNAKGKLKWTVNDKVTEALADAYQATFKFITPTRQRYLVAVDLCEKMTKRDKSNMSPALVAMTTAMTIAQTEVDFEVVTFKDKKMTTIGLSKDMKLKETTEQIEKMGKDNCTVLEGSLPITWALKNKKEVDVFIVLTSSSLSNSVPREALLRYRREMGIFAKLVICSMIPSPKTVLPVVADANDAGMLDMAGVNAAALQAIRNLAVGNL